MSVKHHPVATIFRSRDGGPLRHIINGACKHPTGVYSARKGGGRHMPWESKGAEVPALHLCDVSWRVASLLSQPHRLDIFVRGQREPLQYIPDMELRVDPSFAEDVCSGVPLGIAATMWDPQPKRKNHMVTLVLEIKGDDDPRNDDPMYQRKLVLARKVYEMLGYRFAIVMKGRDIDCVDLAAVREVVFYRFTQLLTRETLFVIDYLNAREGVALFDDLVGALGDEPRSKAAVYALHFDRVICVDLCSTPADRRRVSLIEREGRKC